MRVLGVLLLSNSKSPLEASDWLVWYPGERVRLEREKGRE